MPSIFRFFNARKDRDNTFENYKDKLHPLNEDDPTTVMMTFDFDSTPKPDYSGYGDLNEAADLDEQASS
ncbi:hypothetical protein BGZ49_007863 [Haplosporangium sp. Z 27]|nr:hypothetical protein BGZ49_007863 [Haplosporangium sp. Z 27]